MSPELRADHAGGRVSNAYRQYAGQQGQQALGVRSRMDPKGERTSD